MWACVDTISKTVSPSKFFIINQIRRSMLCVRTRILAYVYEQESWRTCTNENLVCVWTRILSYVYERESCRMCTNENLVVCVRTRILAYVYEREFWRSCTNENVGESKSNCVDTYKSRILMSSQLFVIHPWIVEC